MDKFKRNYILSVQGFNGDVIEIKPPFTIEFDIIRNTLTSVNVSSVRIYNLSEAKRNQIRKNWWDFSDIRAFVLKAGYGDIMPVVFTGQITQASSVREGTNFITTIESFDGGDALSNSQTNVVATSGTPVQSVIENLAQSLDASSDGAVTKGKIGTFPGTLSRNISLSGKTVDILNDFTGGCYFVDNGKLNCLKDDEVLIGEVQVINSASGLLGTPKIEQTFLVFDMLFEPRLIAGQQLKVESITDSNFNSEYKVLGIKHRGMISEAICGDCITTVELNAFAAPTVVR